MAEEKKSEFCSGQISTIYACEEEADHEEMSDEQLPDLRTVSVTGGLRPSARI